MEYRRLGRAGIKVSQLSFGSWVTFGKQVDLDAAAKMMSAVKDYGINFFDNAEVYANGQSEEIMGAVLKKLKWSRLSYVISTKFYWGITGDVNGQNTLNRKYLLNAMNGSLARLGLDYVDLVYCHRPDPNMPMEETVWAMHDMIQRGQALYWGTSEWSAAEFKSAWEIADKHHLHKPIVEQPQYHLMHRHKVEKEFAPLYKNYGTGLTTWSPLASGILTGKYLDGIPEGSRASMKSLSWLADMVEDEEGKKKVRQFLKVAKELGVTPAALAIAWCSKNPNVSTVITGASSMDQLHENMKALDVLPKLSESVMGELDLIFPVSSPA
jgi:voltage-dependent potassium channel beta subunit